MDARPAENKSRTHTLSRPNQQAHLPGPIGELLVTKTSMRAGSDAATGSGWSTYRPSHLQRSQRFLLRQVNLGPAWEILVVFDVQMGLRNVPELHEFLLKAVEREPPVGETPAGIIFVFSNGYELFLTLSLEVAPRRLAKRQAWGAMGGNPEHLRQPGIRIAANSGK